MNKHLSIGAITDIDFKDVDTQMSEDESNA